jgi:hypothetical protein
MLRFIVILATIFFSVMTVAFAKDCKVEFKPTHTTGLMTRMTLYKFTDHYELQFLTPAQLPLLDMVVEIDGVKQPMFLAGGLDDELFIATDDENGVGLTKRTLEALGAGKEIRVSGRDAEGKAESAEFKLTGLKPAVKKMGKDCS